LIPRANITAWRGIAPWPDDAQVEQDLVISRALVELYSNPLLAESLAFRGGTALNKMYLDPPVRYSEDIDLVQKESGPIGEISREIHGVLDDWLGHPRTSSSENSFTMKYRFETSFEPVIKARLKIEINTREHFSVHGFKKREISVKNPWFNGSAELSTYSISELLGTKLRALFQRKKGRDLFDLWIGLKHPDISPDDLIESYMAYMEFGGTPVKRARFEDNVESKMEDERFLKDIEPLLRQEIEYDPHKAWETVREKIVSRLPE